MGLLRCREEPPRLLGNRFQERFFLLRNRCLLLLKEKRVRPSGWRRGIQRSRVAGAAGYPSLTWPHVLSLTFSFLDLACCLVITFPDASRASRPH